MENRLLQKSLLAANFAILLCPMTLHGAMCSTERHDGSGVFTAPAVADDTSDTPDPNQNQNAEADSRDRVFYPGDTERVKPLARKLAGNLLLDQKEIWTSPFRMNRHNSGLWLGFGAITAALIATDHRSSRALENSRGQVHWGNNISKVGASYSLIPLVAGFYAYGVGRDDPKAREVGVLGAEALLDSLVVVQILKPVAGRKRPDALNNKGEFLNRGIVSLPAMPLSHGP